MASSPSRTSNAKVAKRPSGIDFHDAHCHLTNYIQRGLSIDEYLAIMGTRVGRSVLFGLPLQQMWSYRLSGEEAPSYYLHTDAPLYYYSFADAYIARIYERLPPAKRARFDPMIIGFNPSDMYAVDHIRRVLSVFPGVFSGIGEFSIHKEFVSSKVAGELASLTNPALDRIFEFCAETGLIALLHSDIDIPYAKPGGAPTYLARTTELLRRHPKMNLVWAHTGLGRIVQPRPQGKAGKSSPRHVDVIEGVLTDSTLNHVYFDISWDEVAKYVISAPDVLQRTAALLNRFPDRFLFGTDNVAPKDAESYFSVYEMYQPLWKALTPEASQKIRIDNYERLFDAARKRVRAWERDYL